MQHLTGLDPATEITFSAISTSVRHLGIRLSRDADTAARSLYRDILGRLNSRIARWSGFRLSLIGRAHVAKQVLVSMITYHGTFVPVPADLLQQICTAIYTFVAANRPAAAGAAHLFPCRDISSSPLQQGGIALVDIPAQLSALQAKIIGRLLEPEHMAWKILFHSWLAMPLTAQQMAGTPAQHQHLWQLGSFLPFSSFPLPSMVAPRRVIAYLEAFRQLYPHRLSSPADMSFTEVMGEPLFYNGQIRDQGEPAAWEHWARQGLVRVQHLRDFMRSGTASPAQQQHIQQLLQAMPSTWAAHVSGPAPLHTHYASPDPADSKVFNPAAHGDLQHTFTASSTAELLPAAQPQQIGQHTPATLRPVLIIPWDPGRPWHPRHMAAQAAATDDAAPSQPQQISTPRLYMVGAWSAGIVDPRSWGFSSVPAHEYVVRACASRLRAVRRIRAAQTQPISPMRPPLWPTAYGDEHSGIRQLEQRWALRHATQQQPLPQQPTASRIRGAPDPSTDASWMHPSRSRSCPVRDRSAVSRHRRLHSRPQL